MFSNGRSLGYQLQQHRRENAGLSGWSLKNPFGKSTKHRQQVAIGAGIAAILGTGAYIASQAGTPTTASTPASVPAPTSSPGILASAGNAFMNFFRASGMDQVASQVAADQVLRGQRPPPPLDQVRAAQAGMLGQYGLPVALALGAGLVIFMGMGIGGPKRGRR